MTEETGIFVDPAEVIETPPKISGKTPTDVPETIVEKIEEEAVKVEQGIVEGVKEFASDVEETISGIFGTKKTGDMTHGSQNAAVSGLQTDADPGYVHPSQLPKE